MGIETTEKEEKNYQAFIKELEKISKNMGLVYLGVVVLNFGMKMDLKKYLMSMILQVEI